MGVILSASGSMGSMYMPPAFGLDRFGMTSFSWATTLILLGTLALYLAGVARYPTVSNGTAWSKKRTAAFIGATIIVAIATESVVGVYDMTLFSDHMVQHLLLIMVAAGVYAMAAPLELAQATMPGAAGRVLNTVVDSKVGEVIGHPIFGLLSYALLIVVTHLTGLFNLMLEHMWIHHSEQVAYILVGYLFWRPVVAIEPTRHRLSPGMRLVYLALAIPVDSFTGLALVMSSHETFPAYTMMRRGWGPTPLADLREGGAIMWIGGDLLMMLAMIPVCVAWVRDEAIKTKQVDAELDAAYEAELAAEREEAAGIAHPDGTLSAPPHPTPQSR